MAFTDDSIVTATSILTNHRTVFTQLYTSVNQPSVTTSAIDSNDKSNDDAGFVFNEKLAYTLIGSFGIIGNLLVIVVMLSIARYTEFTDT